MPILEQSPEATRLQIYKNNVDSLQLSKVQAPVIGRRSANQSFLTNDIIQPLLHCLFQSTNLKLVQVHCSFFFLNDECKETINSINREQLMQSINDEAVFKSFVHDLDLWNEETKNENEIENPEVSDTGANLFIYSNSVALAVSQQLLKLITHLSKKDTPPKSNINKESEIKSREIELRYDEITKTSGLLCILPL